jgi:hypothetical protein
LPRTRPSGQLFLPGVTHHKIFSHKSAFISAMGCWGSPWIRIHCGNGIDKIKFI